MKFTLNGHEKFYDGDENLSLLKYLRNHEGLISPKDGCSAQGTCGACTVQVNDKAVLSCATPMKKIENSTIITSEGMSEYLSETLARAFVEKGAVQCGFCTPGVIMRAKVLIESKEEITKEDILKALNFHICRCTGYKKIIEAILYANEAIKEKRVIPIPINTGKIGTRQPRYDALRTALGLRPFVADIKLANMLYSALKFSDYPRAKILSIDLSQAEKLQGVIKIFTSKDITGDRTIGLIVQDWPLMLDVGEETRYIGDVIASVVAETEEIAREAVKLIKIEYEVLQPVTDAFEGMKKDSPQIHKKGNILSQTIIKRGDTDKVLAESDYIAKGIYQTQTIEHAFMEFECCVAEPMGDDGVHVYSQGQGVYVDQEQISKILGIPREKVNVTLVPNGGGFGGKEDLTVQGHTALHAYILKRPVRLCLTRDESIIMHPKRHPLWMDYVVGCNKDGILTAVKAKFVGDTGAYASVGMKVLERAAGHATGAYHIPVADIEATAVYTNNIPNGAMRGFGANQANFAIESLIDELCEKGNFDRWQFRYDNALTNGKMTSTGQILEEGVGVRETLLAVKDEFYSAKYAGIACGIKNTGVGNGMKDEGFCKITIESPRHVIISHGWTEMGQGVNTIAVQTLCEETNLSPEIIEVRIDTKDDCLTGMTTSSRATSIVANSIIDACKELKKDLKEKTLNELIGKVYNGKWICDWTTKPGHEEAGKTPVTHYSYGYATQVVVLDDDGNIDKIYAAHDGGKIMNPTMFEGQIEGALHMGLGYALSEELVYIDGRPKSTKMKDLGILRAKDLPEFIVKGVEVKDPYGAYGCKGVGEIGLVPTAPAVTNALYQFDKIRRYTLPVRIKPKRK